jgi:hypothetical protein
VDFRGGDFGDFVMDFLGVDLLLSVEVGDLVFLDDDG